VIALIGCYALRTMLLQAGFQRGNQLAADRVELGQHPRVPLGRNGHRLRGSRAHLRQPDRRTRPRPVAEISAGCYSALSVSNLRSI